jgi:ABC-type sugar transport system substrate-binding protein
VGNGITAAILGPAQYFAAGQIMTEELAYASQLKGKMVLYNVPQYAGSTSMVNTIRAYLPVVCPNCSLDYQVSQVTDVGSLGPTVTAYITAHPDVKFVICSFGDLCQGVGQALKAAGQTGVKVFTKDGTALNFANIKAGLETADIPLPGGQTGWQIIDTAQRIFDGDTATIDDLSPQQWVTTITNPADPLIGSVPNYQEAYKKLWGLG